MLIALCLAACSSSGEASPEARTCTNAEDCPSGLECIEQRCSVPTNTDGGPIDFPHHDAGRPATVYCPDYPYTAADCDSEEVGTELRNRDSDRDGLSDLAELCEHGTNPCDEDSDGDGISDLIEISYGSDPNDAIDNPRARGDFVFVVPFSPHDEAPIDPEPTRDALSFGTDLQKVDVYVSIDTSISMVGEMNNLRASFRTTIVPALAERIPDVWFGVGRFEDCPSSRCANAMNNMQDMTNDIDSVQAALDTLTSTCGGNEPYYQTLWLLATGDTTGFDGNVSPLPRRCTDDTTIGWPCFRPDAVKVIVQAGDESMAGQSLACSRYPGSAQAVARDALNAAGIHYIGIDSSANPNLQGEMRQMAIDTGSVDETTGQPIYFRIPSNGDGLGDDLVTAVEQLTRNVPIRVDAIPEDDPSDAVDAVAAFIQRLETNTAGGSVEGRICTELPTEDHNRDGFPDHFPRVFPGTTVCFDIIPRANQTVPATDEPQIFRARVRVIGDMFTPLDAREVLFLVPPRGINLI